MSFQLPTYVRELFLTRIVILGGGFAGIAAAKFSGFPDRWLSRTLYSGRLPRLGNKVRVALATPRAGAEEVAG